MDKKIKPEELVEELGLEGLCRTAEEYFKNMTDTTPLMARPFHDIAETPKLLCKLGQILSGLRLCKGMTVMDFGAGSCWLSRFINELSCATISVDTAPSAIKIGQTLFSQTPPITPSITEPRFLHFDGRKIQLPDDSVDRIIVFDTFHHIPNQREILVDFYRILKPGGIAGFSDVGPRHSTAISSQIEMQRYKILEQDLYIEELKKTIEKIGFSGIYFKLFSHPDKEITYDEYLKIARKKKIPRPITHFISESMEDNPIFFLIKGQYQEDSRHPSGLKHHLKIIHSPPRAAPNTPFKVTLEIQNQGNSTWLSQNTADIGVVKIGIHLFSENNPLINPDFLRFPFNKNILPNQKLTQTLPITLPTPGKYRLEFDLVSEYVSWFEYLGSQPVSMIVECI
jgi:ubiquinone/menaquinone biosynthesis C-methylase UbiE